MTPLLLALTIGAPVPKDPVRESLTKFWGAPVDPDGDCVFKVDRRTLRIGIPGKSHALCVERGATNAPRVFRSVTGDFAAGVRVSGAFPADNKSLVEGRWAFYGAGLLIWDDENNYVRLERARMYNPNSGWRCYPSWELRAGGKVTRGWEVGDGTLDEGKVTHLWVNRVGNRLLGYHSENGQHWHSLPELTIKFGKTVKVGVVASQNTAAGYEVDLTEPHLAPTDR